MEENTPSNIPQLQSVKVSILEWLSIYIMEQLKKYGLPILLFTIAVWYFWTENMEMKAEIRACNDALLETYRSNQVQLLDVINNNTRALHDYKSN